MGGMGWWFERKLTARFQYRVGPPWYQSFMDAAKLFVKETLIPDNALKPLFIAAPIISFSAAATFTVLVGQIYFTGTNPVADAIVLLYLLVIPPLFVILGAFSSRNPLALTGAAREIKMMLAYEFIFITVLVIVIIKSGGSILFSDIISAQSATHMHIASFSGAIAFFLGIFYIQAKLGIVPFDVAEAEQEIMAGTMIEYSGSLLGLYRLAKMFLYFSLPLFITILLFSGTQTTLIGKILHLVIVYGVIMLIVSVIKNINPRARVKDALGFFWFFLFPLGLVGIILAMNGL